MESSVIPETHAALLDQALLGHLASIGPDGAPQSTPVWFLWDGSHLLVAVNPAGQKYRNLQRDPRLAISFVDQAAPTHYLEIRGRVIEFDPDLDQAILGRLHYKYTGSAAIPPGNGPRTILVIEPLRTTRMD